MSMTVMSFPYEPIYAPRFTAAASRLFFTAAASQGVPSENLMPSLRVKVYSFPSSLTSHFSARLPLYSPSS